MTGHISMPSSNIGINYNISESSSDGELTPFSFKVIPRWELKVNHCQVYIDNAANATQGVIVLGH